MSFISIHYTEMQTYISITWEPCHSVTAVRLSFVLLITHLSETAVNNKTVFILIALCGAFQRCITCRGIQRACQVT